MKFGNKFSKNVHALGASEIRLENPGKNGRIWKRDVGVNSLQKGTVGFS